MRAALRQRLATRLTLRWQPLAHCARKVLRRVLKDAPLKQAMAARVTDGTTEVAPTPFDGEFTSVVSFSDRAKRLRDAFNRVARLIQALNKSREHMAPLFPFFSILEKASKLRLDVRSLSVPHALSHMRATFHVGLLPISRQTKFALCAATHVFIYIYKEF